MLLGLFFLLFAFACFYSLSRDFGASGFIVLVGFLQDPARKLIAGEPIYMTVLVGVVVACITLRRLLLDQKAFTEPFVRWSNGISVPLTIYLCMIFLQGVHSFIRYGSPILTGLGAIFYIAPLIAIIVGYSQFQRFGLVRSFLVAFSVLAVIIAISVLVSFYGVESSLLGEVGRGLIIYDQGTILKAYSGLMRSSEIASWHMGACVCFLIILISDRGSLLSVLMTSLVIILLLGAIVLTGRRKMLVQIAIFSLLYFPLLRYYQGKLSTNYSLIIISMIMLVSFFAYWFAPSLEGTEYDLYLARGTSVFGDAGERFSTLGIGSVGWAYSVFGFFGGGLGVAAQGSGHFVSGHLTGSGEGGLGKLVSELGLISLILIPWLAYAFAAHLHKCLNLVSLVTPGRLTFTVGILTFLLANIPTFVIASQVYGDVFVLLILGLLAGALFALPKQIGAELTMNQD